MIKAVLSNQQEFVDFMSKRQNVVIITHSRPDADALGSSLAMQQMLEKKGHETTVLVPNEYPSFLTWMKGNERIVVFSECKESKIKNIFSKATIIFHLDYSCLNRTGKISNIVDDYSHFKSVLIDHHEGPQINANFKLWHSDAAATCELIFMMFKDLGWENSIDKSIAECLYAGILTDTGCFRHQKVSANVHSVVAKLIQYGADAHGVGSAVYDSYDHNRLKLLGFMLSERLVILEDLKTAYFYITIEDQKIFNVKTGDTEGIVNYALSMKGIMLAALFTEDINSGVKISFRSKGNVAVNILSKNHFEGGGHKNASGGRSNLPLKKAMELFENCIKENNYIN